MTMFRLGAGSAGNEVSFTFNGKAFKGRAGEPLSAALLANGVHLVARSYKYHRPRGILSAGIEEPSALLQIGEGAQSTPNLPATQVRLYDGLVARSQNCYPSVGFDFGSVNQLLAPFLPAGFYYKTFMGPRGRSWMSFEKFIRRAAGLGVAPDGPDPDHYDQSNCHCDLLIVGAGPAGISAALAAAATGARVLLVEQDAELGGSLLSEPETSADRIDGKTQAAWLAEARATLGSAPNVTLLTRTSLFGCYRHHWFAAIETLREAGEPGRAVRQRLWRIRAAKAILATGAIERMMVFGNNDRPGVMLAGAVRDYAVRHQVSAGSKVLFATNNDSAYRAAIDCKAAGVDVVGIVDTRADCDPEWRRRCTAAGIDVFLETVIAKAVGRARVTACDLASGRGSRRIACDVIAISGGWTPTIHLHSQIQGELAFRESDGTFVPVSREGLPVSVGACNGTFGLADAMHEGADIAASLTGQADQPGCRPIVDAASTSWQMDWRQPARIAGDPSTCFVDLQNDVTVKDIRLAVREGLEINEHLKRYCGIGMGTDQGKTGNLNALAIAAEIRQIKPSQVGLTRYRQPFSPVGIGAMAGRHRGHLLHPHRRSPLQDSHERAGAVFEPSGQWSIVSAYRRDGESLDQAITREASYFDGAAMFDASSSAKFEVGGPGALEILDSLYFTPLADLAIGGMRHAVLLTENGTVSDINLVWRLGPGRFLVTTGAARGERLAMLIQGAIQSAPRARAAFLTDVTDRWASLTLVGTKAQAALDASLGAGNGPDMVVGRYEIARVPAFDLLVSADRAEQSWKALAANGSNPVGLGALSALQIEAAMPRIGFEIDGTVNPLDLGWSEVPDKRFVGRRSVLRDRDANLVRRNLVALTGPRASLVAGGQVLEPGTSVAVGYVTSSAIGPLSGSRVNLALVENGRRRLGETLEFEADGLRTKVRVEPVVHPERAR